VGIDVEKVKDVAEMLDIARLHFSPAEYRQLCTIAPQEQLRAFFACWTRKEAFLKGLGEGLNRPLNQLEVGFVPGHTAEPPACEWAPLLGRSWRISAIGLGEGYLGAVAYEGDDSTGPRAIRTFRFSELTSLRI
jgi:4'-phosphopantetheinyl transferase